MLATGNSRWTKHYSQYHKPKRWRPRFSIRTLVIIVTLVCCYAACWGPTKRQGVASLAAEYELTDEPFYHGGPRGIFHTSAVAPFLVVQDEDFRDSLTRCYYFWFFGYVAKLPYERHLKSEWERVPIDFDFEIDDNVTPLSPET